MRTDLQRLKRDMDASHSTVTEEREAEASAKPSSPGVKTTSSSQSAATEPTRPFPWKIVVPAAFLIVVLIAGGIYWRSHSSAKLTGKDTIVLADFTNNTGDSVFDDTLKQALAIQLEQSPFLNVLSDRRVSAALKLMNRSRTDRLTQELAIDLCQRTNSKAVLTGSIANVGSHYLIGLKAVNCQTGDSLGGAEAEAENRDNVLKVLGTVGNQLREKLGESLTSVAKYSKPLNEVTTTSLEALKAFTQGLKAAVAGGNQSGLANLQRSVELDPNFALAYAAIGNTYNDLNEASLATHYFTKAHELRDRVSERERLIIEANYHTSVTGDLERANEIYNEYIQTYPGKSETFNIMGIDPHNMLGINLTILGQYERATAEQREYLQLIPEAGFGYSNLMWCYLALNQPNDAKAVYDQAVSQKMDAVYLHLAAYYTAFLKTDDAGMHHHAAWGAGKAGAEDLLLSAQSDTEAYFGHLSIARQFSQRAVESAKQAKAQEAAALWLANAALREAEFGNLVLARKKAIEAWALSTGRDVEVLVALTLARVGDDAPVLKHSENISLEFPQDTMIQGYWLPTIRAILELNRGNAQRAIELLQATSTYELGQPYPFQYLATMHPIYVRGQAYLRGGQGQQATVEFQKILDHRGIVINEPIGALAHLQLGRAYAMSGDPAKARAAYQDFFRIWKDADPDIPILGQAKAEYTKLQ